MADEVSTRDRDVFDLVIVGSGPVGCAVARCVLEDAPDARILIVEAGPALTDPPGSHISSIVDEAERAAAQLASQGFDTSSHRAIGFLTPDEDASVAPVSAWPGLWLLNRSNGEGSNDGMPAAVISTNVGGLGSHWGGACPSPGEGERVGFIDRAEFTRTLERAERFLRVSADEGSEDVLVHEARDVLRRLLDAGRADDRRVQAMPRAKVIEPDGTERPLGSGEILGELWSSERLELRALTVARRIVTEGGRATGVVLYDRKRDAEYTVDTTNVFVAASTFQSPQLLFASDIRPRALGRYLNDQAQSFGTIQLRRSQEAVGTALPEGRIDILSGSFVPNDADGSSPSWDVPVGVTWVPYERDTFPFQAQIAHLNRLTASGEDESITDVTGFVAIALFAPKDIRFEDRVEFSECERDGFGLPAMSIVYGLTSADDVAFASMLETLQELGSALGDFVPGAEPKLLPPGTSIHYQGGTRMGPVDDGTSVCDPVGKVWGTENVYVGGNGVIPTPTVLNPTLTSVALALRGAEDIAHHILSGTRTSGALAAHE